MQVADQVRSMWTAECQEREHYIRHYIGHRKALMPNIFKLLDKLQKFRVRAKSLVRGLVGLRRGTARRTPVSRINVPCTLV